VVAGFFNAEFLFGVVACQLYHAGRLRSQRHALLGLGLVMLVMGSVMLVDEIGMPYSRLLAGFGFACIVLALVHIEREVDFSRYRGLIFMGAASYALYLVHAPFMYGALKFMPVLPHWSVAFALFALSACAVGVAYHLIIEKPLLRLLRPYLGLNGK